MSNAINKQNIPPQTNLSPHTSDKSQKQEKVVSKQETPLTIHHSPTAVFTSPNSTNTLDLPENTLQLIADLADVEKRSAALDALCLISEKRSDIAIPLWYSYGTIVILLEEIVSVYPYISGRHNETQTDSSQVINKRVCKALSLLQTIASHPKTQHFLIKIDIIYFLTPIFALTQIERDIEYLRLTSLGVIGSMSKTRDPQIIKYLIEKEALTICIVSIQYATEIPKVIATFILSKLFSDDYALEHACDGQEKTSMHLHSLVNENKHVFKEHLLDYILSKEPNLRPKYDEFCRNINFTQK
ncbi:Cell differentiation protein rcd1 [Entamoeba marina]